MFAYKTKKKNKKQKKKKNPERLFNVAFIKQRPVFFQIISLFRHIGVKMLRGPLFKLILINYVFILFHF